MKLKFLEKKKITSDERSDERYAKLITHHDPKHFVAEAYRMLRTNIQFASIDHPLQTIMVTSSAPLEGKTITASNLAVVMAQADKQVLLVDADLRKPTVHHTFRLPNRLGLTNLLVENRELTEVIQATNIPNLSILTSGPIPLNPAELLNSKKMKRLIEELLSHYDLILFDAPSVLAVTDAQILSNLVDGVLLVVNAGTTNRDVLIKAKRQLDQVHANIIGTILNNKSIEGHSYYYYYYN
ncbi:CpsD/CapB family tyrosine-protein kinase [Tepidibacillus sp. LV47]|uniref:CpsD/CapB family tyrosine-protein kinase n=1 Tax=Tepidibacillus sp. LV47 TaxID=3398228 RepID=UPI003AABF338